jgi:hypothetical protein
VDCGINCGLIFGRNDEIVNVYGDEDRCYIFVVVGIAVGIAAVGTEIIIVSNAVESKWL